MKQNETIQNILSQREEFLVIGLTGRMGSGCSRVAEVLATPYADMKFPHPIPQKGQDNVSEEERTSRILAEYANVHWLKFDVIHVGSIIATFILKDDSRFVHDLSSEETPEAREVTRKRFKEALLRDFYTSMAQWGIELGLLTGKKDDYAIVKERREEDRASYVEDDACFYKKLWEDGGRNKLKGKIKLLGMELYRLFLELESQSACGGGEEKTPCQSQEIRKLFDCGEEGSFFHALDSGTMWDEGKRHMASLFRAASEGNLGVKRRLYLELVDELLALLSYTRVSDMLREVLEDPRAAADVLWERLCEINGCIEPNMEENGRIHQIDQFVFVKYITRWFGRTVRNYVTEVLGDDGYARLFQRYGQIIRYYGGLPANGASKEEAAEKAYGKKQDIFAIPRKINQYIKVLRHPFDKKTHRPVRIVVDSIKNIFEAVYLRYRYSAFYLWAISTEKDLRTKRLHEKELTDIQIRKLDWNEYPDQGRGVVKRVKQSICKAGIAVAGMSSEEIFKRIEGTLVDGKAGLDFYLDRIAQKPRGEDEANEKQSEFNEIRLEFFEKGSYVFYTQDIDGCICNADVYLFNNAENDTDVENNVKLLQAVVRNVSLVMYPGLVRPTPVERCMQIALTAKVNSGCLSRQVGAVVTDSQYNILAIGWNDVPCGEVPCAYKNLDDLLANADRDAYSEYEQRNREFRKRIEAIQPHRDRLQGLPLTYCFKDVHKRERDPMRSRAMHAEEKALALCGREAEGGFLFTTSSPCEMCSKNAKNHKIKRIYYIEAYPGISQEQYTNSGDRNNRAELILFSGAVGRAYMQMYTPLLPHKDVLKYLGVYQEAEPSNEASG